MLTSNGNSRSCKENEEKGRRRSAIGRSLRLVSDSAMGVVGLPPVGEEENSIHEWEQRRQRHLRRLSSMKSTSFDTRTATTKDVAPTLDIAETVGISFAERKSQGGGRRSTHGKCHRHHAGKVLWRSASQSLRAKPRENTSTVERLGGKSFLQSDLTGGAAEELASQQSALLKKLYSRPYDEENFFFFTLATGEEKVHDETIIETDGDDVFLRADDVTTPEFHDDNIPCPFHTTMSRQLSVQPPPLKTVTQRRRRRIKRLKREFGKGLVGRALRRTLKRQIVNDENVNKQMSEISDHRTYFTWWLSFVQIAIFLVIATVYPFAPVGVGRGEVRGTVLISDNGVLQAQKVVKKVSASFWIGPSMETLILLGAKYAPCMRPDRLLMRKVNQERRRENKTGCCMQMYNDGCIQRKRKECLMSIATFSAGTVCGQDPRACVNPKSHPPHEWGHDIIKWPVCIESYNKSLLPKEKFPHMHCEITGRPCCIRTQAQCVITSQANCKFQGGYYHKDKTLCAQVDCLSSTCGLLPFQKDGPNQIYRLLFSIFLSAGVFHLMIILIFNFTILRDMEKMSGWYRIGVIYIFSGIGGNLWCAVMAPYEPEVGPSGAMFGIISCLFVEVIQGWQYIEHPIVALSKLLVVVLIMFVIGLLPYIDNFANIFGFLQGFFLAFIFLPYVSFGKWDRRRKRLQIVVSLLLFVGANVGGFILFYYVQYRSSHAFGFFNCVPFTDDFCQNFNHGQNLEKRLRVY